MKPFRHLVELFGHNTAVKNASGMRTRDPNVREALNRGHCDRQLV